jgi:UDP-4-amino-4,6-dideoxy-N-acetyl-beta-L-altrosamine transaminase
MSNNSHQNIANGQEPNAKGRAPIPYGKQNITEADILAVTEALKSDYLTQGPKIKEFEDAFAKYVGAEYAVAVANGTAALHLNALALGVKPGDKVITTPITFAASANCVRYCGGEVVFSDIDPKTYLLDINKVRALLEADTQKEIKGIIPVDFAGRMVDLEAFRKLADEFDCWIIEDACHAPGAYFKNSQGETINAGCGKYADLAIFSFHPVKHIAAGEGGMITTNDKALYEKLMMLRTHGITKDQASFQNSLEFAIGQQPITNSQQPTANRQQPIANSQSPTANNQYPAWYMEMQDLGFNYRLTDFQAALGLSQLERADEGLVRRREIAGTYFKAFKDLGFIKGQSEKIEGHAYHLYVIEVENRLGLYNYLREKQIYAQIHYIPCHLMPYYRELGWEEGDMPIAEKYYRGCLSLPMYPVLGFEEQGYVIASVIEFFNSH